MDSLKVFFLAAIGELILEKSAIFPDLGSKHDVNNAE